VCSSVYCLHTSSAVYVRVELAEGRECTVRVHAVHPYTRHAHTQCSQWSLESGSKMLGKELTK
jgi:hypothetical protein